MEYGGADFSRPDSLRKAGNKDHYVISFSDGEFFEFILVNEHVRVLSAGESRA
jgi:hypothetical protein